MRRSRQSTQPNIWETFHRATLFGLCDRVAALADGEIVAVSTPQELYANRDPWVRRFLTARPRKRLNGSELPTE
jgi:ABC-type transporter Mla maintaining outer membrane lipid asymmetry ATPase subunit MlaF